MRFKFYSDTNLDGFVQSIALFRVEVDADTSTRVVEVDSDNDRIADLADQWGGARLDG